MKLLPDKLDDFRAEGKIAGNDIAGPKFTPEAYGVTASFTRRYRSASGGAYIAVVARTASTAAAYSLLTSGVKDDEAITGIHRINIGGAEVFSRVTRDSVAFVKGSTYVSVGAVAKYVYTPGEKEPASNEITALAHAIANSLDGVPGELPVLVMHLPDWEKKVNEEVGYAVSLPALQRAAGNQPALDAVDFDEGTEAVTARYGAARLVVVEFPTPQHSVDADALINERVTQLRAAGEPAPSAYKRVGNYSVFVFDAPDAASAEQLISGVKYEKDVRWLGRNPHAEENAIKRYTSTMGGVILTTLKTTGLAILLCLCVGGIIGGAVFLRRRARNTTQEIYSDAGGMLRLNIEDLNTPPSSAKLLRRGEE